MVNTDFEKCLYSVLFPVRSYIQEDALVVLDRLDFEEFTQRAGGTAFFADRESGVVRMGGQGETHVALVVHTFLHSEVFRMR